MAEGSAWVESNRTVRRLRKRLRQITHLRLVSHNNNTDTDTDLLPSPSLSVPALSASPLYHSVGVMYLCQPSLFVSGRSPTSGW
jgi:hypothetical protein